MHDAPINGDVAFAAQETVIEELDDKQCVRTVGAHYSPTLRFCS